AAEAQFRPDPGDEGNVKALAVQIAGKVKQEHFEQDRAGVEHRTASEVRHTAAPHAVDTDAYGIDPVPQGATRIEPQIGGRETEFAATLVAMHHFAGHEPGVAEQRGCFAHVTG